MLLILFIYLFLLFAMGRRGVWLGGFSNFVIWVYMLTLQFHPILVMSLEISPLHPKAPFLWCTVICVILDHKSNPYLPKGTHHLTPHLQKSVIWEVIHKYQSAGPRMECYLVKTTAWLLDKWHLKIRAIMNVLLNMIMAKQTLPSWWMSEVNSIL